ncbi:MAG: hypothetical protein HQL24_08465 [Candidatus Omnitrophica bacterium]|nr:hypothetical protein [Candidatus Omnitrophota bacterium]
MKPWIPDLSADRQAENFGNDSYILSIKNLTTKDVMSEEVVEQLRNQQAKLNEHERCEGTTEGMMPEEVAELTSEAMVEATAETT